MDTPELSKVVAVTDSTAFALKHTLTERQGTEYVPIFEAPRLFDLDNDNEVASLVTTIVRLSPERVVLGPQEAESIAAIRKVIGDRLPVEVVENFDEIELDLIRSLQENPYGAPASVMDTFRESVSPKLPSHAVILERTVDVSGVIAANLATSLNACLIEIESADRDEVEDLCNRLMYAHEQEDKPSDEEIALIRETLRERVQHDLTQFSGVSFVTIGLPYGYAFPEITSSHLYSYPNLGLQIANDYTCSNPGAQGVRTAVTIDPSDTGRELDVIAQVLDQRGAFVRTMARREATVERVGLCMEFFPFDFLAISTHCGEIKGRRIAYKFVDSAGQERELIADQAVEFGSRPRTRMVQVQKFTRPVSLDGIDWRDTEGKDSIGARLAIGSFYSLLKNKDPSLIEEDLGPSDIIRDCLALGMDDGFLIPAFSVVGDQQNPVIMNNSCSSWHSLSLRFIHAGARGYLGTLYPILPAEAEELVRHLFGKHVHKPLPVALAKAQNEIYRDGRNPYVYFGTPFARLRTGIEQPEIYLARRLKHAIEEWQKYIATLEDAEIKSSVQRIVRYLVEEYQYLGEELEDRSN